MPISDTISPAAAYSVALDGFVTAHVQARGRAGVVQAYAAVQSMPYFSGPDRTPLAALRSGRGACTAKHLILRDVLRRIGVPAEVEIVEGDFAAAIPLHPSQPPALQEMIGLAGVTDFHCRVRIGGQGAGQRLDATWPEDLAAYGFAVNRGWAGEGDTLQAIPESVVRARDEDVLGTKARLLAGLSEATKTRRLAFLRLLSVWLAEIDATQGRA